VQPGGLFVAPTARRETGSEPQAGRSQTINGRRKLVNGEFNLFRSEVRVD
jgi:hypothetical protein